MTRKYTDNELLALTRNRREAKALKTRMEKLDEERSLYHDMSGKEKSKMKSIHKEHRRSSGTSPFLWDAPEIRSQSVDPALMRRFSKPWSICPAETTHNIVFKEISSVRPISSVNTPRPKSEPNRKRKSMTPRSSLNGRTVGINKDLTFCEKDNMSTRNLNSTSNEGNSEQKAADNIEKSKPEQIHGDEDKSVLEETKMYGSIEKGQVLDEQCKSKTEITSQEDSNGNATDGKLNRNVGDVNGNKSDVNGEHLQDHNDTIKSRTQKKKRKSMSKRPSTAFTTVLPSVSEVNKQVLTFDTDTTKSEDGVQKHKPDSVSKCENGIAINEDRQGTEREIISAVEEFASLQFSENNLSKTDKSVNEINTSSSCDVHFTDESVANGNDGNQVARPVTRIGTERQTSHMSSVSVQQGEPRPSTVAGGEVLDFESSSDGEDGANVIYFKGQKLRNYVSPQRRYKQDPFRFKRREKLFTKLAKDDPDIVEQVRKDSVKVEVRLSKSARSKILDKLVIENSQRETSRRLAQTDTNMNGRIKNFIGSISYLCSETDERSKQMHPLLA